MKKQILIKVTKEHIQKGLHMHCSECPIALAAKEELGEQDIHVGIYTLTVNQQDNTYIYQLSRSAIKFIYDFDSHKSVQPTTFKLKQYDTY